jgi:rRNA maturation RNase YbeY
VGKGRSVDFINGDDFNLDYKSIELRLIALAHREGKSLKKIQYNFVSREMILKINASHLQHNYETDIITFDYTSGDRIVGDIYVCPEVVRENSTVLNNSFENELMRVVVHGLLHLIGYGDSTQEELVVMRRKEDEYLNS